MIKGFDKILGQRRAVETLERAIALGSLANAYLFEGPESVGKEACAIAFAKALVAGGDFRLESRIDNDQHPDVRVFRPRVEGSRNIPIETLRQEILPLAQFAPFEAQHSFFVFPDADISFPSMHAQAANALLKTLEEPKRNVHFILTSSRPFQLLTTIRSRCQRIAFEKLSNDTVKELLKQRDIADPVLSLAANFADGSVARALHLAEEDQASTVFEVATNMHRAVESCETKTMIDCAEQLAKREDLPFVLDVLQQLYRQTCRSALDILPAGALQSQTLASVAPAEAARRALLIDEHRRALEHNANPLMATEALLLKMCYISPHA